MRERSSFIDPWVFVAGACALLSLSSGCAATLAARQPTKKDLTVLTEGVPRTRVTAELGAPVWTEERDGTTIDVFAFKQGYSKGVKATRAFTQLAADIFTFGLRDEAGTRSETAADGANVKVEVAYDENYNVQSVQVIEGEQALSDPSWLARLRRKRQMLRDRWMPAEVDSDETPLASRTFPGRLIRRK